MAMRPLCIGRTNFSSDKDRRKQLPLQRLLKFIELFVEDFCNPVILRLRSPMAAESKDLFAFRRGFTDLLPNRSLDYARDDSLVRNLQQLHKLQFTDRWGFG